MSKNLRTLISAASVYLTTCSILLTSCSWHSGGRRDVPAERIFTAGHGTLFDQRLRPIELDIASTLEMQESMISILKKRIGYLPDDTAATVAEAKETLQSQDLTPDEGMFIRSGIINALLRNAPGKLVARFAWRNKVMISHFLQENYEERLGRLPTRIRELLVDLDFFKPLATEDETDYIAECRSKGVPIPPDWAETGTAWVKQGDLDEKIILCAINAAVWTYSHPSIRGGCIALPRGTTGTSGAGIICQSATTGHACFWDNKRRDVEPEATINWKNEGLVLSELKDGTNLDADCTRCHRGDNVFLLSPDDPTWAKLLRGPLSGPAIGTFTTRIESPAILRYIPIPLERPFDGWGNPPLPLGCSESCHETPTVEEVDFLRPELFPRCDPPKMPPDCAGGFPNPARCYVGCIGEEFACGGEVRFCSPGSQQVEFDEGRCCCVPVDRIP